MIINWRYTLTRIDLPFVLGETCTKSYPLKMCVFARLPYFCYKSPLCVCFYTSCWYKLGKTSQPQCLAVCICLVWSQIFWFLASLGIWRKMAEWLWISSSHHPVKWRGYAHVHHWWWFAKPKLIFVQSSRALRCVTTSVYYSSCFNEANLPVCVGVEKETSRCEWVGGWAGRHRIEICAHTRKLARHSLFWVPYLSI